MARARKIPQAIEPVGIAEIHKKRWQLLVRKPTFKEHYWARFVGANGETVGKTEEYTQKHNLTAILRKYYPNFEVQDLSGE
jgi:hypothetical protein